MRYERDETDARQHRDEPERGLEQVVERGRDDQPLEAHHDEPSGDADDGGAEHDLSRPRREHAELVARRREPAGGGHDQPSSHARGGTSPAASAKALGAVTVGSHSSGGTRSTMALISRRRSTVTDEPGPTPAR